MAKIDIKDQIPFSRERVYETFRDHLAELLPFLPTVQDIKVESYERVDDNTVKIVNIWKAAQEEIPTVAQPFIKPEMLMWTDRATWEDGKFECHWDMEVGFLKEAISCSGTTRYIEKGDKTEIHIAGDLQVDARKIPGVPRLVAGRVGSAVEGFVVRMITPNLKEVNRGAESYLKKQDE